MIDICKYELYLLFPNYQHSLRRECRIGPHPPKTLRGAPSSTWTGYCSRTCHYCFGYPKQINKHYVLQTIRRSRVVILRLYHVCRAADILTCVTDNLVPTYWAIFSRTRPIFFVFIT